MILIDMRRDIKVTPRMLQLHYCSGLEYPTGSFPFNYVSYLSFFSYLDTVNVANEENDCGCHYRGEKKKKATLLLLALLPLPYRKKILYSCYFKEMISSARFTRRIRTLHPLQDA